MQSIKDQSILAGLADEGWEISVNRAFIQVRRREINIEFCLGDYCVGVFDEHLELEEGKFKEATLKAAAKKARELIKKYSI